MAEETKGTPPAEKSGLTLEEVNGIIAKALKPITETQASIAESLKALAAKPADKQATEKDTQAPVLTLDAIDQLIEKKLGAAAQSNQAKATRDAYLADKLKDLPAAYRNQLGSDPAKFATEEQAIRDQYKADLKAAGAESRSIGNANGDGGTTPENRPVDKSKLDPVSRIASGLK